MRPPTRPAIPVDKIVVQPARRAGAANENAQAAAVVDGIVGDDGVGAGADAHAGLGVAEELRALEAAARAAAPESIGKRGWVLVRIMRRHC